MAIFEQGSAIYPAGPDGIALAHIRRMPRWAVLVMALATLAFTAFSLHFPVALLANAGLDDDLFVQNAGSLLAGHWLGPFSNTTLAKGPGFPFFIAANAILGLPITLSLSLLYSGACAQVAVTLYRILGNVTVSLACFLLMQWHPAMIPVRIIRDDLSAPQVLLIVACVSHYLFLPSRLRTRLAWGVASGILLAWFWMTREDGLWLLPGLAIMILLQAFRLWPWKREIKRLAVPVIGMGVGLFGSLGTVAAINLAVYGTFTVVDFKSPDFARALTILQSVRAGDPVPFVPVPAKVRAELDKVSPAFASLEPYFHGNGRSWTEPGCAIYPSTCSDFAGGWFMWALRDGVASLGDYASPQTANAFYRHLWSEVHAACVSGQLHCEKSLIPFMPAVLPAQWRTLPAVLWRMYRLATWQGDEGEWTLHQHLDLQSEGTADQLQSMENVLRHPMRSPAASDGAAIAVAGWFHRPDNLWLRVRCTGAQGNLVLPVIRRPSPDLAAFFHTPTANLQRFVFQLPSLKDCWLEPATGDSGPKFSFRAAPIGVRDFAGGVLSLDSVGQVQAGQPMQAQIRLMSHISHFYARLMPKATVLALAIYGVYLIRALLWDRRRRLDATLVMITGIGAMLLARAAILTLVDMSSFPAILPLYWAAGYPLLALAIVLAWSKPFQKRLR